ncbi:PAS domain-containing protein [Rosistilla oblonga]|uniref:PAS domain-containing protein n=1 Tax=Rosistilla oblonga TaxID=2527990 RepID=UPI003A9742A9
MKTDLDLDQFVQCVGDAIIAVDRRGEIILWNPGAVRLLGYSADEVLGKSMDFFIPHASRKPHWDGFHSAIASGQTHLGTNLIRVPALHKNGQTIRIALTVGILRDAEDQIEAIGAIIREDLQAPKQTD